MKALPRTTSVALCEPRVRPPPPEVQLTSALAPPHTAAAAPRAPPLRTVCSEPPRLLPTTALPHGTLEGELTIPKREEERESEWERREGEA